MLVRMQSGTATWEDGLVVSYKTKCSHNLAITLLGICLNELKMYDYTETCSQIFIAALFIIAKTWKQPRCLRIGECINKLWYIQTIEYHLVLERNELSSHKKTRRKLKCILLSERILYEKATYCMIPTK